MPSEEEGEGEELASWLSPFLKIIWAEGLLNFGQFTWILNLGRHSVVMVYMPGPVHSRPPYVYIHIQTLFCFSDLWTTHASKLNTTEILIIAKEEETISEYLWYIASIDQTKFGHKTRPFFKFHFWYRTTYSSKYFVKVRISYKSFFQSLTVLFEFVAISSECKY